MSIWVFEFNNFVEFKQRIDVCLTFCSKNSNFSIIWEQFIDIYCKHMRDSLFFLTHLISFLNYRNQNFNIVEKDDFEWT